MNPSITLAAFVICVVTIFAVTVYVERLAQCVHSLKDFQADLFNTLTTYIEYKSLDSTTLIIEEQMNKQLDSFSQAAGTLDLKCTI